jgi:hypothetical protein
LRTPLREKTNHLSHSNPNATSKSEQSHSSQTPTIAMENILFGQTSDQLNLIEKAKNVLKHYEQQQSRSMFNIFP